VALADAAVVAPADAAVVDAAVVLAAGGAVVEAAVDVLLDPQLAATSVPRIAMVNRSRARPDTCLLVMFSP
jgi:hypothetical protein